MPPRPVPPIPQRPDQRQVSEGHRSSSFGYAVGSQGSNIHGDANSYGQPLLPQSQQQQFQQQHMQQQLYNQHQQLPPRLPPQHLSKPLPSPPSTSHLAEAPSNAIEELPVYSMRIHDQWGNDSGKDMWSYAGTDVKVDPSGYDASISVADSEYGPMSVPADSKAAGSFGPFNSATYVDDSNTPSSQGLVLNDNDSVFTTYQYALRYAMLVDADNAQLAARSRSIGGNDDLVNRTPSRSSGSELDDRSGAAFSVKTVSKATGAPNFNNRTPTLVVRPGGRLAELTSPSGGNGVESSEGSSGGRFKGRGWRTSIFELGDNAARRLKAEISNAGKLKDFARGKLSSGGGSSFPSQPPSLRNPAAPRDSKLGSAINKALMQQLKTSAGASSVHPFTSECYMSMYEELRNRGGSESTSNYNSVDDLIDLFTDISHQVCGRLGVLVKSDVSRTVDNQVSLFVKLLRSVLQAKAHTSREAGLALLKLDDYSDSVSIDNRARSNSDTSALRGHSELTDQQAFLKGDEDDERRARQVSTWLKNAFHVPDADHRQMMMELRREVNQETAIHDLRTCLLVLRRDMSFAGKPEDFRNRHTYEVWKEREATVLEQVIQMYSVRHQFMSGEQIAAGRLKLEASAIESMGSEEIAAAFEYIPTHAAFHFRTLIQTAIEHDVVANYSASDLPTDIKQLSIPAKDLLKQLSIAWRISKYYRETCYLDVIDNLCERGVLPETYLIDAFGKVESIVHLMNPQEWQISQYEYLLNVESRIQYRMLNAVQDIIEELDQQKPEKNEHIKRILRALIINDASSPVVIKKPIPQVKGRREEILSILGSSIDYRCECLDRLCFGEDAVSLAPSLDGFTQLAHSILNDYERCRKMFSEPILADGDRRFDIAGMVAEVETEYFWTNLKRHVDQFGYADDNTDIESAFDLYKLINKIEQLHSLYSERVLDGVSSRQLFKDTLDTWLRNMDSMKAKWFENALKVDNAPAELDIGKHSTSVIDLVFCFSQLADIAQRLEWPDAELKAHFLSQFMKHVGLCFELYASVMLKEFQECMRIPTNDSEPKSPIWNSMWNSRKYKERLLSVSVSTQNAIAKLDQSQPVQISPMACIKLNNLTIAIKNLNEMLEGLDVEGTLQAIGGDNRLSIKARPSDRFVMSFKVIRAEGLEIYKRQYDTSVDMSARPYVKLALTRQTEDNVFKRATFATTRPAPPGSSNPRWNESFELPVVTRKELQSPLEARICTRDGPKRMGFREKTRSRAYFAPPSSLERSADGSVDMVLDLEPAGHLLLHVTMDSERDDVEFYSGKMFRCLERTLSDMQQQIVDQVSIGIREYLRQILVVQPSRYRSASILGTNYMGVERSIQFLKRDGHQAPGTVKVTQESCFEALIPLIDYLEDNLHTLFTYLYEDTANGVIGRTWSEVLVTLEDILLPPLRGPSKGHARPLTETYLENIYECLKHLKWYFGGGDDGDGISDEVLEGRRYAELMLVREMYFLTSRELIDAYMHEMHQSAPPLLDTGKSGYTHAPVTPQMYSPTHPAMSMSARDKDEYEFLEAPHLRLDQPVSAPPLISHEITRPVTSPLLSSQPQSQSQTRLVPPPLPRKPRPQHRNSDASAASSIDNSRNGSRRFSTYTDASPSSSSESLGMGMGMHNVKTAIVPTSSASQSGLSRSRSVWAHKNTATIKGLRRKHRMVTDTGDIILRILRLRFDKEATKFVQTQLELRSQQMQYEMRRAAQQIQS
ncbi:hypothetical protein LPJ53_003191 [Coemansia erecta]|uniref:C2 domain-containing protein n=1 Tax=Coemansia erecta TaxID=147472 RepID=A0A9W8CT14_9FUNG|nr:hypothetical protein LPJ53_003191 [Coemansia erecta]